MDPPDLYDLLATIVRVEAGLRLLAHQRDRYAPNGHYDRVCNLVTVLQAEVNAWLDDRRDPPLPGDARQTQRRQQPDRRVDSRRSGTERRGEPPASEHVG